MDPSRNFAILEHERRAGHTSQILPDSPPFAADCKTALRVLHSRLVVIALTSLRHWPALVERRVEKRVVEQVLSLRVLPHHQASDFPKSSDRKSSTAPARSMDAGIATTASGRVPRPLAPLGTLRHIRYPDT